MIKKNGSIYVIRPLNTNKDENEIKGTYIFKRKLA